MRLAFFSVDTTVLFIRARRMGLVKARVKTQTHLGCPLFTWKNQSVHG